MKRQHLGETVKALGDDDFPRKMQHKYKDAGKPIFDALETLLDGHDHLELTRFAMRREVPGRIAMQPEKNPIRGL